MLHETSFRRAGSTGLTGLALVLFGLLTPAGAMGELPSSHLLVPYFEVDLVDPDFGQTTLFSVANSSHRATDVRMIVHTNWGVPVLELTRRLGGGEVATVNLRDWLVAGRLPDRQLNEIELAHLQAALSGEASPQDALYYSTRTEPGLAVGYITIGTAGRDRPEVLWGDFFVADPERNSFQAETLVNLDRFMESGMGCRRHAVRYLNAGPLEHGTQVVIWTGRRLAPSHSPEPIGHSVTASVKVIDETGRPTEDRSLDGPAVQVVEVGALDPAPPYGWLDIRTEDVAYIGEHLHTTTGMSAALRSYCLPRETLLEGPAILIQPLANGIDAESSPVVPMGSTINWEYVVSNGGMLPLSGIVVSHDASLEVICPKDALDPGESMYCGAQSTASVCQRSSTVEVTAQTPEGITVSDQRTAQYYGQHHAAIDIVTRIGNDDANEPPGPAIPWFGRFYLNLTVTNSGDVALTDVVLDTRNVPPGGAYCPCPAALLPGESFDCVFRIWTSGDHFDGSVTGSPPCGPDVAASDPAYYHPLNTMPAARLEKWLYGQQANNPPGPGVEVGSPVPWEYHITNVGDIRLPLSSLSDEGNVVVTCPTYSLAPGESTVCSGSTIAEACLQGSIATLSWNPPGLTIYAAGYYFGVPHPAVEIETRTNGEDADQPPGPTLPAGGTVEWTYLVTNRGDVALQQITVWDSGSVPVTCPQNTLAIGESMTCHATGTAVSGQYSNTGFARAIPLCGYLSDVSAADPSHYLGQ